MYGDRRSGVLLSIERIYSRWHGVTSLTEIIKPLISLEIIPFLLRKYLALINGKLEYEFGRYSAAKVAP